MSSSCSVFCGISLDGSIARADGTLDFPQGAGSVQYRPVVASKRCEPCWTKLKRRVHDLSCIVSSRVHHAVIPDLRAITHTT